MEKTPEILTPKGEQAPPKGPSISTIQKLGGAAIAASQR
jgi:hypothetical protein